MIFCALNIIFSLLTLPLLRKPIIILFLLGSAVANYFMFSYGAVIDANMMQNAFETNSQEATALFHSSYGIVANNIRYFACHDCLLCANSSDSPLVVYAGVTGSKYFNVNGNNFSYRSLVL